MHEEMSLSVALAINVLLVSWIVSIVLIFTVTGQNFSTFLVNKLVTSQSIVAESQISSLNSYGKPIPATTVYKFCSERSNEINSIGGFILTKDGRVDIHSVMDLKKIFSYKVNVTISRNSHEKYDVGITDAN